MLDRLLSWLYTRKVWGPRCSERETGCACCDAWATHDWLFREADMPASYWGDE